MKALVIAVRRGEGLMPLTDEVCPALLPVGGRALLIHTLESLASSGIRHVGLIVMDRRREVETLVGDGRRWGLVIEYLTSHRTRDIEDIIRQRRRTLGEDVLVVQGDMLRSAFVQRFLDEAVSCGASLCAATVAGESAGLWLVRKDGGDVWVGAETDGQLRFEADAAHAVDIPEARLNRMDSLAAYHSGNLDVAAGCYEGLRIPGRHVATGIIVGDGSRLPMSAVRGGPVVLAQECTVHPTAELEDSVVLSDGVIVDAHATLRSTVVLSQTYIGSWVNLTQAIVRGQDLISVDAGATVRIADTFLLSDLAPRRRQSRLSSWYQRLRDPVPPESPVSEPAWARSERRPQRAWFRP